MAQIDEKQIEEIVSQVLRTLQQDAPGTVQPTASVGASSSQSGVFSTASEAIAAAENRTSSIGQTWVCQKTRNHRSDQRGLACECETSC